MLLVVTGCLSLESPHPITTPEWIRGDRVGPLPEDGSAPARVAISAHEIRFKGSRTWSCCPSLTQKVVVRSTAARSTNHEYKLILLTTDRKVDLLFRRLEG